jgi:glycosyltransferase involved in cell wall biosynthesis
MQRASFLVFPSEWYEGFPMTIVEAFATGLPVVASRLGSAAELIRDGETGRHYRAADPRDLAAVIEQLLDDDAMRLEMGRQARLEYEEKYTPARNYQQLMQVYALAMDRANSVVAPS